MEHMRLLNAGFPVDQVLDHGATSSDHSGEAVLIDRTVWVDPAVVVFAVESMA